MYHRYDYMVKHLEEKYAGQSVSNVFVWDEPDGFRKTIYNVSYMLNGEMIIDKIDRDEYLRISYPERYES